MCFLYIVLSMCFLCVFYISLFDTLCRCPPRLIILLNKISDRDCSNLQIAFLFTNFLMSEQTDFLPGIDYRWLFSSTTLQLVGLQRYSDVIKCISSSYFSTTKRRKYQTWKISYDFFISCFSFLVVSTYKVRHWSFYSNHILRSLFDPELNFALNRLHLHVWVENQMHEKHLLSSRHLPKGLTLKWSKLSIWK